MRRPREDVIADLRDRLDDAIKKAASREEHLRLVGILSTVVELVGEEGSVVDPTAEHLRPRSTP